MLTEAFTVASEMVRRVRKWDGDLTCASTLGVLVRRLIPLREQKQSRVIQSFFVRQ